MPEVAQIQSKEGLSPSDQGSNDQFDLYTSEIYDGLKRFASNESDSSGEERLSLLNTQAANAIQHSLKGVQLSKTLNTTRAPSDYFLQSNQKQRDLILVTDFKQRLNTCDNESSDNSDLGLKKAKESKILKIVGIGEAEKQREMLEGFGPILFLENHYSEKK